jgi:hypothetical protein
VVIAGDVERTSDLPRTARALRMLRESMHACAREVTPDDLLHSVCDVLVGDNGFARAWAALGSERLLPAQVAWGDERDPVVRAFATQQLQAELVDAHSVPRLADAARLGMRAAIALPLVESGRVLGVIEIQAREGFVPEEVAALDELATNVSFAIAARRAAPVRSCVRASVTYTRCWRTFPTSSRGSIHAPTSRTSTPPSSARSGSRRLASPARRCASCPGCRWIPPRCSSRRSGARRPSARRTRSRCS